MLTVLTNKFSGKSSRIYAHMDDLLTTSSTWSEHIDNLELLLETLRINNLSCNPTKCEFAATEIEYLRYCISEKGIQMSPRKIKVIKSICPPTNYKSLQRLLGLFNFWRKFVRDFAQ